MQAIQEVHEPRNNGARLRTLRDALLAVDEIGPGIAQRAHNDDVVHPETFAEIKAAGLPSYIVPSEFGGGGALLAEAAAVIRALAMADASAALVLTMHYIHTTRLLTASELSPETVSVARRLAATDGLLNFTASEGHSGAPSRGGRPVTEVVHAEDGSLILNGHKRYVTGSVALDIMLVTATADEVDPESGENLVRTLIVDTSAPGIRIEPTWDAFGLRGSASNDVIFDDVRLSREAVVTAYDPNTSPDRVEDFYSWWSLLLASIHLGIALAARPVALEFAAGQRNDGRDGRRADQPHTREHAVRMEMALLQAQALLDTAIERYSTGHAVGLGPAVKLLVHQHSTDAVDRAARLIGGVSVWPHSPVSRYYRDLRVASFNPPNEDVVIDRIADRLLDPEDAISLLVDQA